MHSHLEFLSLGILFIEAILKRNWIQTLGAPTTVANLQIFFNITSLYAASISNVRLRDAAKNLAR